MNIDELGINIKELVETFIVDELDLLEVDPSEQAIANRLARKLETVSKDWNVDCEYNRDMHSIKRLKYALSEHGDIEDRKVVPDIIVHRRKSDKNLLAVEIKKTSNREDRFKDRSKLKAFREQLGYRYTLFIDFRTGKNACIENLEFHIS
jgi:hypothetical protein